nr:hypothetical protein [uncultured Pseudomonas sp.]
MVGGDKSTKPADIKQAEAVSDHPSQVLAEGDTDELIRVVVCSQGSGPGAKPRFHTVVKVMRAMGVKLHAQAVHA